MGEQGRAMDWQFGVSRSFLGGTAVKNPAVKKKKNPAVNTGDAKDAGSIPGLGRSPWRRERLPTPVFLPGESH